EKLQSGYVFLNGYYWEVEIQDFFQNLSQCGVRNIRFYKLVNGFKSNLMIVEVFQVFEKGVWQGPYRFRKVQSPIWSYSFYYSLFKGNLGCLFIETIKLHFQNNLSVGTLWVLLVWLNGFIFCDYIFFTPSVFIFETCTS